MFTLSEITKVINAKIVGKANEKSVISHFCIDSRRIQQTENTVFIAIKGPQNDGHIYLNEAYSAGITIFIVSDLPLTLVQKAVYLQVKDTTVAFQKIAALHLKKIKLPVIAITGSNGKTIVKEWLYEVLKKDFKIIRNPKSYNSQIGVPLSVLKADEHHNLGIFEAGISEIGEMVRLEKILRPTFGIFTNIGDAHSQGFKDLTDKIDEKLQLFNTAKYLIYCKDHGVLNQQINAWSKDKKIKICNWSFKSENADLKIFQIEESRKGKRIRGIYKDKIVEIDLPFKEPTSIENAVQCWLMALVLGVSNDNIKLGMLELEPVDMRLKQTEGINTTQLIHDYYNSDLTSIEIATDFLARQQTFQKRTVILSDIEQNQLPAAKLYRRVSAMMKERKIDRFIGIGKDIKKMHFVFKQKEMLFFENTDDFLAHFNTLHWQNESILLKGARSFKFEKIARLLQKQKHQTYLEINLNHIESNFNYIRTLLKKETKIMAMVKAYAYGSGTNEVSKLLQYNKADYLAVAYADEGVNLRKAGIHLPIMVLNTHAEDIDILNDYLLEPVVYDMGQLNQLLATTQNDDWIQKNIHLEFDTGMHRLGFEYADLEKLKKIFSKKDGPIIKTIFSHLAASESLEHDTFTHNQIKTFTEICMQLEHAIGYTVIKHIANTGGILYYPSSQFNMVRLGIGLYGIDPGQKNTSLLPVSRLISYISQIKTVAGHEGVSYGLHSASNEDRKIAVIAIGYADGVNRKLSQGKGYFTINGQRAPIVGNICMDMTMVDVTDIECATGDEVEVMGRNPRIEEVASEIGTIPYEILTNISERVKRIFVHE
jgi:Alr-MurF fusion protein